MGQRTCGPKGQDLEQAPRRHVRIHVCFRAGKLQMQSRSPKFPTVYKLTAKTATGSETLQPEIKSNEYSNTRGSPTYSWLLMPPACHGDDVSCSVVFNGAQSLLPSPRPIFLSAFAGLYELSFFCRGWPAAESNISLFISSLFVCSLSGGVRDCVAGFSSWRREEEYLFPQY